MLVREAQIGSTQGGAGGGAFNLVVVSTESSYTNNLFEPYLCLCEELFFSFIDEELVSEISKIQFPIGPDPGL